MYLTINIFSFMGVIYTYARGVKGFTMGSIITNVLGLGASGVLGGIGTLHGVSVIAISVRGLTSMFFNYLSYIGTLSFYGDGVFIQAKFCLSRLYSIFIGPRLFGDARGFEKVAP